MFEYYATVLLWQRLVTVKSESDYDSSIAENLTKSIGVVSIPDELLRYLEGIGNIKDPSGRQAFLALDAELNENKIFGLAGHYGRVDPQTHITYETQPAPFVIAYRMLYEYSQFVAATEDHGDEGENGLDHWPSVWNLPADLAPPLEYLPNRNLLGWAPIHPGYTLEMSRIVERYVDVDHEHGTFEAPVRHVAGIPIFKDVIEHVVQMLTVVKRGAEMNSGRLIEGSGGSCSQVLYHERVSDDVGEREVEDRLVPVAERIQLTQSDMDVGMQLSCAAAIFKYRISRRYANNNDCYCYTTRAGRVAVGWRDTEDRVFQSAPRWNFPDLCGARVSGSVAALDFIKI